MIDGIPTRILHIRGQVIRGEIVDPNNFSMTPCFVVRDAELSAHGSTLHEAREALRVKRLSLMETDERINLFRSEDLSITHAVSWWHNWHGILTGSCKAGRDAVMQASGLSPDDLLNLEQFLNLVRGKYGWEIIQTLEAPIPEAAPAGEK